MLKEISCSIVPRVIITDSCSLLYASSKDGIYIDDVKLGDFPDCIQSHHFGFQDTSLNTEYVSFNCTHWNNDDEKEMGLTCYVVRIKDMKIQPNFVDKKILDRNFLYSATLNPCMPLLTLATNSKLTSINVETGTTMDQTELKCSDGLFYSKSGHHIIIINPTPDISIVDSLTLKIKNIIKLPDSQKRFCAQMSPDNKMLLVDDYPINSNKNQVHLVECATGKIQHTFIGFEKWIDGVAISNNGNELTIIDRSKKVQVWDVRNYHNTLKQYSLQNTLLTNSFRYMPNDESVLYQDWQGKIFIHKS